MSYNTLWHTAVKKRSLRCPSCADHVGKDYSGIRVLSKFNGGYSVACIKAGHIFNVSTEQVQRAKNGTKTTCLACRQELIASKPKPKIRHGLSKRSPAYRRWRGMKTRCRLRGIELDPQWLSFETFYADMGEPPENRVLDRIENTKGYSKANCRWADYYTSTENRRNTIWLESEGKKLRVAEFARRHSLTPSTVYQRLFKHWPVERLGEPKRAKEKAL